MGRQLRYVLRERPDAVLWIAGEGSFERKLVALAERKGMTDAVTIRAVPGAERQRWADELAQASVAVLMSSFETHPIAALEAAALGCRLVVADAPGLRELAAQGIAKSVKHPADAEALARVILGQLDAPPPGRQIELPSWDECARDLCSLYESVLERDL